MRPMEQPEGLVPVDAVLTSVVTPFRRVSFKRTRHFTGGPEETPQKRAATAPRDPLPTGKHETRESAVARACSIHQDLLLAFEAKTKAEGADAACAAAEAQALARRQELLSAVEALLPRGRLDQVARTAAHRSYEAVSFAGCEARDSSREALCAALAALASRKEMCWLQSGQDCAARGYFAPLLADPLSRFRLALASPCLPTSLVVTRRVPLKDALDHMDSGGPLARMPGGGKQFALQDLLASEWLGSEGCDPAERQAASTLRPEPQLEALLGDRPAPVLVLEAYAGLAPRALKEVREIVLAELLGLLRAAKAAGETVVFQLGGQSAHRLAAKVYLRPSVTEFGLRCGYLRWRPPQGPWARETPWENRVCIGLQLP